jgi:5-methylcytosine-specific restriction protein A
MSWFYQSYKWRKFSKAFKKRNPLCVDCLLEDVSTPVQVTDHKIRYLDGGLGFDLENLEDKYFDPLCNDHHNSKSGKESHGFKRGMG